MSSPYSYDEKCKELADHFLSEYPEGARLRMAPDLAQHIQYAVEEFLDEQGCEVKK